MMDSLSSRSPIMDDVRATGKHESADKPSLLLNLLANDLAASLIHADTGDLSLGVFEKG